jgi:predicted nucleotidyltransferase
MDAELRTRILAAAQCLRAHGATEVYLFGSARTDQMRDDSDVDLAVTELPPGAFFRAMAEASRIVGRHVDLLALERYPELARELHAAGELDRVA